MIPISLAVGLLFLSLTRSSAGNLACAGNALDWYTDVVGETPCTSPSVHSRDHSRPSFVADLPSSGETYQRLRQLCNSECTIGVLVVMKVSHSLISNFADQVLSLLSLPPGDRCDDLVSKSETAT